MKKLNNILKRIKWTKQIRVKILILKTSKKLKIKALLKLIQM